MDWRLKDIKDIIDVIEKSNMSIEETIYLIKNWRKICENHWGLGYETGIIKERNRKLRRF
jgi:hypothetical protein